MATPPSTPPTPLTTAMSHALSLRRRASTLRSLTLPPQTSVDFSSNDFLSLSSSPLLRTAYLSRLAAAPNFHLGSGGSRLLDGNSAYALALEADLAAFHRAPAALLFNSGFDANAGFFSCVPQPGDAVLHDALIHASVHEGLRLSRAGHRGAFAHNDAADLRAKLEQLVRADERVARGERSVFVAVESLYSMDGDVAPLREIVEAVEAALPRGNGCVVVDEAHATGVYGERGRGIVSSLGLEGRVFARLHTFGKALACNGAVFLCSPLTREYLVNYARPLIYTTFMSFPALVAIRTVYELMMQGGTVEPAARLWALVAYFYSRLEALGFGEAERSLLQVPARCPESPIISILSSQPRSLAGACQDAGFVVRAIVPPTVPEGGQRVRVCLHAGNSFEEVDRLVATMGEWVGRMKGVDVDSARGSKMSRL